MTDSRIVLGSVVHRLSNDLGIIPVRIAHIRELRASELESDHFLSESLERIEQGVTLALEFVRRLRSMVVLQIGHIEIWPAIAEALRHVQMPDSVDLLEYKDNPIPEVLATEELIEVFENLISNAIEAMPDGGRLQIDATTSQDKRWVIVTVKDTGQGIPPELQCRVFEGLATTKRHGQGLGLWWSNLYLEYVGGRIDFESEKGKGACFTVSLPAVTALS